MKSSVAIVGAGVAGMTAAVHLSLAGHRVTLIDKGPQVGGRTLSFKDPETRDWIDNGPHLLMGCYRETLRLLDCLGTRDQLLSLPLRLLWLAPDGRRHVLRGVPALGRLGLLWGLLRLSSLGWRDRWAVIRALRTAGNLSASEQSEVGEMNCQEWLQSQEQTPETLSRFWEPLLVAALNETPERSAADGLVTVIREALLSGAEASRLLIPRTCLRDLFQPALQRIIEKAGGTLLLRTRAQKLLVEESRVAAVQLAGGEYLKADRYILAIPPWTLSSLLPESEAVTDSLSRIAGSFTYSPIVSLYLWVRQPVLNQPMVGLLDSSIHWVFQRRLNGERKEDQHLLAIPLSAAREWVALSPDAVKERVLSELCRFIPDLGPDAITHWRLIKERRATVSLGPGQSDLRPRLETPLPNLFLSGDWTATGLPATIEGAAVSGRRCAEKIL